jgi:hypothetical protein
MGNVGEGMDVARKKQPQKSYTPEPELLHPNFEFRRQAEKTNKDSHNTTPRGVHMHSHEKTVQHSFEVSRQDGSKGARQKAKLSPRKAAQDVQRVQMESGHDIQSRRKYDQKTESINRLTGRHEQGEAVSWKVKKSGKVRHSLCQKTCRQLVVLVQPDLETWRAAPKP